MPNSGKKRRLKFISLELKERILDRLKKGERVRHVATDLGLNEATIRCIQKNEETIRSSIAASSSTSAIKTARSRAPILEKMEKALIDWIDESSKERTKPDSNDLKLKAMQIYKHLIETGESPLIPEFDANKDWFYRFKKRFSLKNMRRPRKSTSIDTEAAKAYPEELQRIIAQRGYSARQVFNAAKTTFCWKKLPKITFITNEGKKVTRSFSVSSDRVTLLMCSNATGDHIVKPMLVYKHLNPHAMRNMNKNALSVYWTASKTARVTADLFEKWFLNYFVPSVESYLKEENLDFKVLLILDGAPSYPRDLNHPIVEVTFLPPKTASLIQPLNQGVISTFKTYFIEGLLEWVLVADHDEDVEAMKAWRLLSMLDCLEIVSSSVDKLRPSTLNAGWRNIWPESVQCENLIEPVECRIDYIMDHAKIIGGKAFVHMNREDIEELLVDEEGDEVDLVKVKSEIEKTNSEEVSAGVDLEIENFLKSIEKGINLAEQLESHFVNTDTCVERSRRFREGLQKCLVPYYKLCRELSRKRKRKVEHGNEDAAEESSDQEKRSLIMLSSDEETQN
ncbi:PREDICTED: tigger transposable element-derived protein 1-like [Habropoda laboriosa]|uniref:tigger transposable element-derived protein 1-like n=1 Tax=Habropoda laboriosa TaxID=597456 RepID=UPI00083D4D30|nr:PREDICTED: tigger transposable element-derived protein 1-like [Habropoda laboriosa]